MKSMSLPLIAAASLFGVAYAGPTCCASAGAAAEEAPAEESQTVQVASADAGSGTLGVRATVVASAPEAATEAKTCDAEAKSCDADKARACDSEKECDADKAASCEDKASCEASA